MIWTFQMLFDINLSILVSPKLTDMIPLTIIEKDEITVYFIEVKTGTSALSTRQRKVMEAVKSKRVEWLRISIKDFGEDVNELLLPPSA